MKKKWLALALATSMTLSLGLSACGGGSGSSGGSSDAPAASGTSESGGKDYSDMKIAVLLAGPANDNGWNATAYNALTAIHDKYGLKEDLAYSESVAASDMEEFLRGYAQDGYDMIVGHGSQFVDAVHAVAPDYPDSKFVISYAGADSPQEPNVAGVGPVNSGFLAGAVAAAASKTKKIVMLGGEDTPSIAELVDMFEPGAKYIDPDITVETAYIGTTTDADKAKEVALGYTNQGFDVLCASANNAGLGVIQAAEEAGVYAIGYNADQYSQAPDAVIVSVLRDFQSMFDNVFQEIANGTFEARVYSYGLKDGGTKFSDWHGWDEKLPDVKQKMDDLFAALDKGELDY
ncbi:BMP family protein [Pseudoflavonifractor sp. MSJ-37]|uniref:BMP family protein n=1 Tax=Pseudoflavonifractor sp. MSJ-37 TaxID=2841531 RepID=UPI001C119633|nr:BMP family protein [Pseudoflavonifractor sp. MSJ-37]MBU5435658.1 BMP family protein [Pseudoflavonifractor sp. MSJ-37]